MRQGAILLGIAMMAIVCAGPTSQAAEQVEVASGIRVTKKAFAARRRKA